MEHKSLQLALDALGSSLNEIVKSAITVEDILVQTTEPVVFNAHKEKGPYGQGLQWKGSGITKQMIYRANRDRIWSSENLDLAKDRSYNIDNVEVLSKTALGTSVRESSLTTLGTVKNLRTQGDLVIDEYIYYNSTLDALGIGTDSPNGKFSVATLDAEFIIDTEPRTVKIGTWTASDIKIITDDTTRLSVKANGEIIIGEETSASKLTVNGKIGINVKNLSPGVDLAVAGDLKFQNKRFSVGVEPPNTGSYKTGDVVWNEEPKPTGYVGWICVKEGTPGVWKPFGVIGS